MFVCWDCINWKGCVLSLEQRILFYLEHIYISYSWYVWQCMLISHGLPICLGTPLILMCHFHQNSAQVCIYWGFIDKMFMHAWLHCGVIQGLKFPMLIIVSHFWLCVKSEINTENSQLLLVVKPASETIWCVTSCPKWPQYQVKGSDHLSEEATSTWVCI